MLAQKNIQLHIHASSGHPIKLMLHGGHKNSQRECQDDFLFNIRITATEVDKKTSLSIGKDVSLTIIRGSNCTTVSAEDHDQLYQERDFLIYSTSTLDLSSIVFKIDVCRSDTSNAVTGIVGHGCVSSSQMSGSSGSLIVVLVNDNFQYVGTIKVVYLLTYPWLHPLNHTSSQQARRIRGISGMKTDGQPYLCGHRGAGESFNSPKPSLYPENTISAFKAASKQGIDFIEMDVQVSKDKVAVIFHDGTVKLCLQSIKDVKGPTGKKLTKIESQVELANPSSTYVEVPVKDLTLAQIQHTKVFGIPECAAYQNASAGTLEEDFKLFPTLKQVFEKVPEETGLMLELKYPLEELGGENIDYQRMDENEFVDSILQVVFDNAKDRKVVLASFDANICFMCQMKQSLFPVFFITQDDTTMWDPYTDLRTRHIDIAIATAKAQHLDGLHTFSNELFKTPEKIDKVLGADLILSVWGEANDDPEKRKWLEARGVHCIQIDNVFEIKQKSEAI